MPVRAHTLEQAVRWELPWFSRVAIGAVIAMGALVLLGWAFDVRPLIELLPTVIVMNPVTALAFVLAGCCFWRLSRRVSKNQAPQDAWTIGLGGIVTLIGLLRVLDCLFGLGFHVDHLLFPSKLEGADNYPISEMALNTALNFLLCGLALLLFNVAVRGGFYVGQALVLVAGWIALLALIGYTYRVLLFYRLGPGLPMSLDTALCFALFCVGFFAARPRQGVMEIITSDTTAGAIARRLLPVAILLPWGLGAALLLLEKAGYYGREFGVALFAVATIILFTGLLWWKAKLLYRLDLDRSKAEDQLRRAGADLQKSNTELQQFAYVASHDLFEPLRMITSYLQLLDQRHGKNLDRQAREFVNFAMDGAQRMQDLIQDLLGYARLDVKRPPFAPTDCEQVFNKAVSNLKVAIEENSATVTHQPLPTVMADPVQLTQVFQNLMGNAIKFRSSQPPHVDLRAQRRNGEWLFEVRDNGIGIDSKFFERIFVIFQRLHTRQEYSGTGMGLAICKRVVERHGGRIWVESSPGEGSRFFFTLPAIS